MPNEACGTRNENDRQHADLKPLKRRESCQTQEQCETVEWACFRKEHLLQEVPITSWICACEQGHPKHTCKVYEGEKWILV